MTKEIKNTEELETYNNKTKIENKKSNIISPERYEEAYNKLSSKYPKLFNKQEVKLLKTGIRKEIIADGNLKITKSQLAKFLKVYCTSSKYKELHVENAKRYDLEGNEAGVVMKEQIEGLVKLREETRKKRELKKQRYEKLAKKQEEKNNSAKVKNKSISKDQQGSTYSKTNNDRKVRKAIITQDNIGNFINNVKSKLGLKR